LAFLFALLATFNAAHVKSPNAISDDNNNDNK
jgi:hypothetical protein